MMYANWIRQAKAHWKEFLPAKYKALEKAGELDQELLKAAEATAALMDQWRSQGATETEAWEIARNEFLFPGPEQEVLDAEEADLQAERDERYPADLLQAMSRSLPKE